MTFDYTDDKADETDNANNMDDAVEADETSSAKHEHEAANQALNYEAMPGQARH